MLWGFGDMFEDLRIGVKIDFGVILYYDVFNFVNLFYMVDDMVMFIVMKVLDLVLDVLVVLNGAKFMSLMMLHVGMSVELQWWIIDFNVINNGYYVYVCEELLIKFVDVVFMCVDGFVVLVLGVMINLDLFDILILDGMFLMVVLV